MKLERGQSLFELLLAIGVSAIVITVLVSLVNNAVQNAAFSRNQTQAARYSEAGTEWLRSQRDTNITTFLTNATGSWCLKDAPLVTTSWNQHSLCSTANVVTGTPFTRQVDFTTLALAKTVVRATVTVTWSDSKGTHSVRNVTDFSDWRER